MRIDRIEFLELTLLLSLAGCDRSPAGAPASAPEHVVIPAQPPPVVPIAASSAPPPVAPAADHPGDGACANAAGSLAACERVGPACEGLGDECRSIGQSLRPRVAEHFAECFAKSRPPRCRDKTLGACMRKAIESACVEPFAEAMCHELAARCKAAKKPAKYTFDQCTRVVSAVNGGAGSHEWTNANMDLLGPSAESGSCSLEYVLPYQPWGFSWR